MAKDPTNVPELNLVIDALKRETASLHDHLKEQLVDFKSTVDRRFAGVNYRIYLIVGLMIAGLGGGYVLRSEIGEIKENVASIKADNTSGKERLTRLEDKVGKSSDSLLAGQDKIQDAIRQAISTIESARLAGGIQFAPLMLDAEERQLVRKSIIAQKKGGDGLAVKIGSPAPEFVPLFPLPQSLWKDIPRLRGYRFFLDDQIGTINLVNPSDNRVAAIV